MSDCCDVPKAGAEFVSDEIVLFGVELTDVANKTRKVKVEGKDRKPKNPAVEKDEFYGTLQFSAGRELRLSLYETEANGDFAPTPSKSAFIAAYGYAFEGHCYRFDKPKIFIIAYAASPDDAQGCGFTDLGYKMWRVRSLDQALELTASYDTLQRLALEANLPGRRSPNTYGSNMQLAHRSGRVTT